MQPRSAGRTAGLPPMFVTSSTKACLCNCGSCVTCRIGRSLSPQGSSRNVLQGHHVQPVANAVLNDLSPRRAQVAIVSGLEELPHRIFFELLEFVFAGKRLFQIHDRQAFLRGFVSGGKLLRINLQLVGRLFLILPVLLAGSVLLSGCFCRQALGCCAKADIGSNSIEKSDRRRDAAHQT